jgi:hypothetical protein
MTKWSGLSYISQLIVADDDAKAPSAAVGFVYPPFPGQTPAKASACWRAFYWD